VSLSLATSFRQRGGGKGLRRLWAVRGRGGRVR
jgi:hypothetical protein